MRDSADSVTGVRQELPYRYDARLANEIEGRWQSRWEEGGTFASPNPTGPLSEGFERFAGRPKAFVMDMFPYPSGAGLHVGHPLGYIGTDVFARFLRMTGHHVLHPFGYDAFGLPAEQYAIETGQHPRETTDHNIANMRRQLRRLGLGHDRTREIATTDVSFYRWTQWIFREIFNSWYDEREGRARPIEELEAEFESGRRKPEGDLNPDRRPWAALSPVRRRRIINGYRLAYLSDEQVNWCPDLGTVLADEEVTAEGRSAVGNYPVHRRPLRQWMLRITAYAERLLDDLEPLEWPESIKQMQRNWIGPSDGATIEFPVAGARPATIKVFTTRPDTLPGATFLVLAPEHPLLDDVTAAGWPRDAREAWQYLAGRDERGTMTGWTPRDAVSCYREALRLRGPVLGDRCHGSGAGARSGVFTGSYAVNPATGERLPVFVADYVHTSHGTGAIMAVPAHDGRDLEFARTFELPVRAVLEPPPEWYQRLDIPADTPSEKWPEAFTGDGAYRKVDGSSIPLAGLGGTNEGIAAAVRWLEGRGIGARGRSYRLRDWLFSRQRYWGEPFPIVYDEYGQPAPLPDDLLPVTLPQIEDFRPQLPAADDEDAGSMPIPPLARAEGWAEVELDLGDGPKRYRRELNTMPQWAGSCWYYLRYLDPSNGHVLVDPEVERYWMGAGPEDGDPGAGGVDLYVGGVEQAVLHLLYARFWHKVLYDRGHVSTKEPFRRLYNQGYILADAYLDSRGQYVPAAEVISADGGYAHRGAAVTRRAGKMGKSRKNAVGPDDIYASYGADTLRLYEMAMGPLDADRHWSTDHIAGAYRFLQRLWRNLVDERTGGALVEDVPPDDETARRLHRTIAAVRRDFGDLRFNTAVARLTELNNHTSGIAADRGRVPRGLAEPLVLMVAPLAPHIAEELWQRLGHNESLTYAPFPHVDTSLVAERTVVLPVQVNGKTRFRIEAPAGAGEEEITSLVEQAGDYARYIGGRAVQRVVVVPDRVVNLVTT